MEDRMGCFHKHEFHINLRNLVVIVRYFVLLDEAVSDVFQSLISNIKYVYISPSEDQVDKYHHI